LKLKIDEIAVKDPKLSEKARKQSVSIVKAIKELPVDIEGDIEGDVEGEIKKPKVEIGVKIGNEVRSKVNCNICTKPFDFFRKNYECKNCKRNICRSCSKGNFISAILHLTKVRICKLCLPILKEQIELKIKEKPELRLEAEPDLKMINLAIQNKNKKKNHSNTTTFSSSDSHDTNDSEDLSDSESSETRIKKYEHDCPIHPQNFDWSIILPKDRTVSVETTNDKLNAASESKNLLIELKKKYLELNFSSSKICFTCTKEVSDSPTIYAYGNTFHRDCFVCKVCNLNLCDAPNSFKENALYCSNHKPN